MNRTVRCRSVAVPWSLFPRELSVGQVLSLSLLWRGHDCRTWAVFCTSSQQGQRADFQFQSNSCGTPSLIFTLSLGCPSTFTRADLSRRKQRIHLYIRPDTPAWITLRSNPSLYTLSKALDRSYNTATVFSLFLEGILYFLCE